jgi:hypothetical protein
MDSFSPRPLYPRYPLYRRLAGPQSQSGRRGEEKNSKPFPGIEPRSKFVSILTELFQLITLLKGTASTMYCHDFLSDYRRGFGFDIGFIDHFNTHLIITLNYSTIADLHTLQITITHTSLSACSVFIRRFQVTASTMVIHLLPCLSLL